ERIKLAEPAAEVRVAQPKRLAVNSRLFIRGQAGLVRFDADSVLLLYPATQLVGLFKKEAGIEKENIELGRHPSRDVDQNHSLDSKPCCQRESVAKLFDCPSNDVDGQSVF